MQAVQEATANGHAAAQITGAGKAPRRPRLHFIDLARGLAIAVIVAGHCYLLAWGDPVAWTSPLDWIASIVTGGTALFVFISGLMFHHVYSRRFDYADFMGRKARQVLLPYLCVSTFLAAIVLQQPEPLFVISSPESGQVWMNYALILATGQASPSLWYIPFITLIFLLSPVFMPFTRAGVSVQALVLAAAFGLGLLINRSPDGIDPVQGVLHFAFYYLLGMAASMHMDRFRSFAAHPATIVSALAATAGLALAQSWQGHVGNYSGAYFEWLGFNYMYPQKLALIIAVCGLFIRYGENLVATPPGRALNALAAASFPIFFLHGLVIAFFVALVGIGAFDFGGKYPTLLVWSSLVVAATYALTLWLKRLLGSRSMLVIGG